MQERSEDDGLRRNERRDEEEVRPAADRKEGADAIRPFFSALFFASPTFAASGSWGSRSASCAGWRCWRSRCSPISSPHRLSWWPCSPCCGCCRWVSSAPFSAPRPNGSTGGARSSWSCDADGRHARAGDPGEPRRDQVWHLAVASFINGIGWASDHPVRRMMIGDAVGAERIGSALSIDTATNNGSRVAGPDAGRAAARPSSGSRACSGSAWRSTRRRSSRRYRIGMRRQTPATKPSSFITSIREGLAWLHRDRRLIGVFVMMVIFNVFGWPATSMVPVIGTDYLKLGPERRRTARELRRRGRAPRRAADRDASRAPHGTGASTSSAVGLYLRDDGVLCDRAGHPGGRRRALPGRDVRRRRSRSCRRRSSIARRPVEMRARLLGVVSVCIGTAPDRLSLSRLSRRDVHAAHRDRRARGAGDARDAADAALLAGCVAALKVATAKRSNVLSLRGVQRRSNPGDPRDCHGALFGASQ